MHKFLHKFFMIADNVDLTKARWYRTYSANGSCGFVEKFEKAKVWSSQSAAKSKCTQLGSAYLVEFCVGEVIVTDMKLHRQKVAEKRRQEEARRAAEVKAMQLDHARLEFERAKSKLDRLMNEKKHAANCACKSCVGM